MLSALGKRGKGEKMKGEGGRGRRKMDHFFLPLLPSVRGGSIQLKLNYGSSSCEPLSLMHTVNRKKKEKKSGSRVAERFDFFFFWCL